MNAILENLINGNLSDARNGAEWYSWTSLKNFLLTEHGYSLAKSCVLAHYLKTGEGFQETCDID